MVVSLILFFIALVMMMIAVLSVLRARRVEQIAKVNERLEAVAFLASETNKPRAQDASVIDALDRWLNRVGLRIKPGVALAILAFVLLSGWIVFQNWGGLALAVWWGVSVTVGVFIPQVRYKQKLEKLISQIPLFIDQVIRGLVTGRNVEGAIKLAALELQEPLAGLMDRVQRNVALGADMGDALREAANVHDVKELHMLALAIHTSRVYGGSPREMLDSVVNLIRQREQMQRELRAMTGETRVTAWVLGLMPIVVVGFMATSNPEFLENSWNSPSGRPAMLVAGGLQALGALILWRMIKSI